MSLIHEKHIIAATAIAKGIDDGLNRIGLEKNPDAESYLIETLTALLANHFPQPPDRWEEEAADKIWHNDAYESCTLGILSIKEIIRAAYAGEK